jgi:hypothetical protein
MTSWIYLFSKFTSEALLFEALMIFILCCGYTAFWVLRKRRYGAIRTVVPSGPVKSYLNELIFSTEQIRLQLFGLLAGTDYSSSNPVGMDRLIGLTNQKQLGTPGASDSESAKAIAQLEAKVLELQKLLENLSAEKNRLERELADSKAGQQSGNTERSSSADGKEDAGSIVRLQQRVQDLESKLAEYNVIEDDLANLKRLQQENATLKSTLLSKGIPVPEPGSNPGTSWPSQAAPAATETPTTNSSATRQEPLPSVAATAPETAASADASTPPPAEAKSENEKSEADLVAEFERMLKG